MSIRVNAARLLGVGAAALALSAVAASPALACAHGTGKGGSGWNGGSQTGYHHGSGGEQNGTKPSPSCRFSTDGGSNWSTSVDVSTLKPSTDGKIHVEVKGGSGGCTVSLASYITHGATWETSGQQTFVDFDSVKVAKGKTDTLNVNVPDAGCFAQIDLYKGDVQYDGQPGVPGQKHGDLPSGPDHAVIGANLINSWNGGTKDCTTEPSTSPSDSAPAVPPTPTDTPSDSPSESATGTPSDSPSESATGTPSDSPSDSASSTPAPSESATVASPSSSVADTAAPPAAGSSTSSTPAPGTALADTGSSGMGTLAAAAGALAVVGGGALLTARRKAARR